MLANQLLKDMDEPPFSYLQNLQRRLGDVAFRLTKLNVTTFPAVRGWCPPVNAYQCEDELVVCVDLAGVDRSAVELRVEPFRVLLRGCRASPEPPELPGQPPRILALEIDHGPFEREITLPAGVDPESVRAEYRRGFLWIHLPLARSG